MGWALQRLMRMGVPGVLGGARDATAPTCVLTSAATEPVSAAFDVTVTFSETVTGFDEAVDVTVGNGTAGDPVDSGDGIVYTVTITPTANGTVTVDVAAGVCTDAAGNENTAATQLSRLSGLFMIFSAVMGAGETLTLQRVTPTGANSIVVWGDGGADSTITDGYTSSITHVYTNAGTYTVQISHLELITHIDLRDPKIAWIVSNTRPIPQNLISVRLISATGITWSVGSVTGANMPAGATEVTLSGFGLTWSVGSVAGANMPTNLQTLTVLNCAGFTVEATDILPGSLTTIRIENALSQAAANAFLAALYLAFPTRTGINGTVDLLGGSNAAPTGTSPGSAECPPTTGWNTAYELVNDSCGVSLKHWASVSCQT